jgi:hypothetical protein
MLERRGHDLAEFLQFRDELKEGSSQDEEEIEAISPWEQWRRRSGAATGMGDPALN